VAGGGTDAKPLKTLDEGKTTAVPLAKVWWTITVTPSGIWDITQSGSMSGPTYTVML